MNFNPDGSVDVTVGNRPTVGVNVSQTTQQTVGMVSFAAYSGSTESHGLNISASIDFRSDVTVGNRPTVGVNVSQTTQQTVGMVSFAAYSGSTESHGLNISASIDF